MFGTAVVCYLFLGGAGGGLCAVLAFLASRIPFDRLGAGIAQEYRLFFARGFGAAAALLLVGSLCLLADSGNYPALPRLFMATRATYLSIGACSLAVALIACAAASVFARCAQSVSSRACYLAGCVGLGLLGLTVALYTGLFLADMPAVAFWHSVWLPVLFLTSSLSCGLAAVLLIAWMTGTMQSFRRSLARLGGVRRVILAIEALSLAALVGLAAVNGGDDPLARAQQAAGLDLVAGSLAPLFWCGAVGVGLLAPVVVEACRSRVGRASDPGTVIAPLCVLVGAWCMRYAIVEAGVHPVISLMGA